MERRRERQSDRRASLSEEQRQLEREGKTKTKDQEA